MIKYIKRCSKKKLLTKQSRWGIFLQPFLEGNDMKTKVLLLISMLAVVACAPILCLSDHGIFPVYNMTHLSTTGGDVYNFYSPGINYTFNSKQNFGFFSSVSILFPRKSSQNGESIKNSDYYEKKLGGDLLMGAGMKFNTGEKFTLLPSVGLHINAIRLRGKELYKDFYNLSFGIGLNLQARYGIGKRLDGTAFASTSWDFVDLIHQENRLQNGLILTFGLGITL
jgi:hypothetical protein